MAVKLITFTDDKMTISAGKLVESALRHGVDSTQIYTPEMLPPFFVKIQEKLFEEKNRYGWYCWKPYCVLDAILKLQVNDTLIYCDAGNEIISNVRDIVGRMDGDLFLFGNGWLQCEWTKMDIMSAINGAKFEMIDTFSGPVVVGIGDDLLKAEQVQASTFFIRVTEQSIKFFKEWFAWSLMPGLISDEPSILPNVPTFSANRWDQSILGALQIKHKIPLHWFPSTTNFHNKSKHPNDQYPALVWHHRRRNSEYGNPS